MSSILNSISSGDLQVQQAPGEIPVKEDSILEMLQNSEIEFTTCPNPKNNLDNFNTGFGESNELHYDIPCKHREGKTPLYKENYLRDFKTEEEKALARNSLGLYSRGDVVMNSLLTIEDTQPSKTELALAPMKHLRKQNVLFAPITHTKAVFNDDGSSLQVTLTRIQHDITTAQDSINAITKLSKLSTITSLGDVQQFLQGFKNGDNLHNTLDRMNQEMLRFENTGYIKK
jgi:hypothetical protein